MMNVTTAAPISHYLDPQNSAANHQSVVDQSKPYVRIVEQPARAALRFRYQCEGRSAGSLPGANSTNERKTYPTIEIVNYHGKALVVVSCVTINSPYRPHPHQLVGKDGCRKGVCSLIVSNSLMRYQFESLGIQCVRKRDIVESLQLRESINVDPFKTGFAHKKEFSFIDLNAVRLCFEVYLEDKQGNGRVPLTPVVSDIIYDKKTMADLCIYEISHAFASVSSQQKVIILCNCVLKDNIEVRFYELDANGNVIWEGNAQFLPRNVYKQTAISFKIPKYRLEHISQPVECYVQLRRKSDGHTSQSKKFFYLPDNAYQPINQLIKSLSNSLNANHHLGNNHLGSNFTTGYSHLSNYPALSNWSSLGNVNGLGGNFSNGFMSNGLNHSPATYSLMANNLANCLSNSLPPNFVNNLAIQNLPQPTGLMPGQQQQASLGTAGHPSTISTPVNGKKRPRVDGAPQQYHPNPAYNLQVKRNCLNKNLPTPYSSSNQIILNSFNPSGTHTLANTLIDLDNLQQFSGNGMIQHLPVSTGAFSMPTQTLANPNSLNHTIPNSSFSSTNTSLNQSGQELQIEPTYLDFKNQLYQSQMVREELSQRANVVS